MKTFPISWTNSENKKCKRDFDSKEERTIFAEMLYVNKMDKLGKISMKRPTKDEIDVARAVYLKDNPYGAA